ncbi:MAG TPA: sulfatase-like hydrolase/transferase, partial [Gammaproteobacteria bacterium]
MKSLSTMILPLICGIGLANAQTTPAEPNFLFIFIDDQAWDATAVPMLPGESFSHTPTYQMPNLERIAERGIVFSQAYATHPKCEGSRSALQMGRTSTSLNAVDKDADNWSAPPADSIANALKRANSAY